MFFINDTFMVKLMSKKVNLKILPKIKIINKFMNQQLKKRYDLFYTNNMPFNTHHQEIHFGGIFIKFAAFVASVISLFMSL